MTFPRNLPFQRPGGNSKKQGVPRPPLRTIGEMAEEFGLPKQTLAKAIAADPAAPRRELRHVSSGDGLSADWYEPRALRRWWKARQEATSKEPA